MSLAQRVVRALVGSALLVLILAPSVRALTVTASSVVPAGPVPLGTIVTVTATLQNDSGLLGRLAAAPGANLSTTAFDSAMAGPYNEVSGNYAILASDPALVADPTPSATLADFGTTGSQTWVQWQFTGTRTGTVTFSVLAYDEASWIATSGTKAMEGCDPARAVPLPAPPFTAGPGTCALGSVQFTSALIGHATAAATVVRPAGVVFPGDQVILAMSLTNTGSTLTVNAVVAGTAPVESNAVVLAGTSPATPFSIPGGNQQSLIWSYSVDGNALPGQHVRFFADVERTLAYATTLYVAAAPITIAATLYVDPDGAGILDTLPAGVSYATINDEVWVVADITNTSGAYTVVVDPVVDASDQGFAPGPDFKPVGPRVPAGPVTLTPFTSTRFMWKYQLDRLDYYQQCLGCGGIFADMTYTVKARGVSVMLSQPVLQQNIAATLAFPPVVQLGETFTATVWLTNTADRPVTFDTSVHPLLDLGAQTYVNKISGPLPVGYQTVGAGQAARYVFTMSASGIGTQPLNAGVYLDSVLPPTFDWLGALGMSGLPIATQVEVVGPSPFVPTLTTSTLFVNGMTARNSATTAPSYLLVLSVANSTTCDSILSHVTPNDNPNDLQASPNIGPAFFTTTWFTCADCPSMPCTINGGVTVTFTATVQGSVGYGDVDWTGTMTGLWGATCGSFPFTRPYTSNKIHVRQEADLTNQDSVHAFFIQSSALETKNFQVVAQITPAGENPVDAFALSITPYSSVGAAFHLISAPVPPIPTSINGCGVGVPNICPGATQSYTWTFQADAKGAGAGEVWFTFSASGVDRFDGQPVGTDPYDPTLVLSATTTGKFRILKASIVTASVWTEPDMTSGNQCEINVILDAMVDGDTDLSLTVTGLSATTQLVGGVPTHQPTAMWFSGNGGAVLPPALTAALPDPATWRTKLDHGTVNAPGDNFFTWSYIPDQNGAGDLRFSASITAQEMALWLPESSTTASSETYALANGTLTASLLIDRSVATTAAGQFFTVTLRVQNTGSVPTDPAFTVTITAIGGGCGGGCTGVPVKMPYLSGTLFNDWSRSIFGCGDTAVYSWTFTNTVGGEGCVAFTATIAGLIGGVPRSAAALSTCLTVVPRPPVKASLVSVSPASVLPGKDFTVTVQLDNPGATQVSIVPSLGYLTFSSPDLHFLAPSPNPALLVGSFSGRTISAKVHVDDGAAVGTAAIGFSAGPPAPFVGTDVSANGPVPVDTSGQLTVTIIPPEATMTVQENPWHPLKGTLPIRYITPKGGKTVLKVYNLEGQLIQTLVDEVKAPGDYTAQWNGKNEDGQVIAAGIFLVRYETTGFNSTKKLAVIK